ncbi:hypothetical protein [Paenibacillus sp. S150]|uniref:hypothetical protein n=1 Tax=Paenibacillus sp. S150 TaxID=2749826 RepID=UPI001C56E4F1|nr:hypothetical protein [Paenibacillus sp. S150]MBW4085271.1 hypothetical protein [Paenibacillus sp. S150]
MSGNKIGLNKDKNNLVSFENDNYISNKVSIDFDVIYTDTSNVFDYNLHLAYRGDQLQLVQFNSTQNDNRESNFMEKYSRLMTSLFIEDYIYNDVLFYKKMLGEEYAFDGYALSQKIVEAFFNRFFT